MTWPTCQPAPHAPSSYLQAQPAPHAPSSYLQPSQHPMLPTPVGAGGKGRRRDEADTRAGWGILAPGGFCRVASGLGKELPTLVLSRVQAQLKSLEAERSGGQQCSLWPHLKGLKEHLESCRSLPSSLCPCILPEDCNAPASELACLPAATDRGFSNPITTNIQAACRTLPALRPASHPPAAQRTMPSGHMS